MGTVWDDLFFGPPKPWYIRTYRFIRCWVKRGLRVPFRTYYACKYAWQRVTRGWDDRILWSVDYWLSDKMPKILKHFKENLHSTPCWCFEGLPTEPDNEYNHTDEAYKVAEKRWDEILDRMIEGWEASARILDGLYEKELGPYPLPTRKMNRTKEEWNKLREDHYHAVCVCEARDRKIMEEGLALFVKYFHSLWN
jgi:hypothetical protein